MRVLFVCTGNSARSQMAEALLATRGGSRFSVASAGARPASRVSAHAVAALREIGIDWTGHAPRGLDGLDQEPWDLVVTVCDRARDACPVFPAAQSQRHWSIEDPAEATGTEQEIQAAFRHARDTIAGLIDELLAS
jgi:arsenate reductase